MGWCNIVSDGVVGLGCCFGLCAASSLRAGFLI